MSIKNILDIENNRNENELYLIHLFKEGMWWSGYELSALLCHFYKNNLKDKLKINKKHLKKENIDYIKIGLMEKSFDKYLPNNDDNINIINENHIVINAEPYIDFDINIQNKDILLNNIKSKISSVNIIDKDNSYNNESITNNNTVLTIFNDVLLYDTNNKSKEELIDFIYTLKSNINKTFLKMFY